MRAVRVSADAAERAPEPWKRWSADFAPARRLEFVCGRLAASACLEALGYIVDPGELGSGEDRAPQWPPGFRGSITHSREWALAVAGRAESGCSFGFDLEIPGRLSDKARRLVLTHSERSRLEACNEAEGRLRATLIFSLKEAFYKWQYPLTGQWLGFQEAEVSCEDFPTGGRAQLKVVVPRCHDLLARRVFQLRYALTPSWVLAGCSETVEAT